MKIVHPGHCTNIITETHDIQFIYLIIYPTLHLAPYTSFCSPARLLSHSEPNRRRRKGHRIARNRSPIPPTGNLSTEKTFYPINILIYLISLSEVKELQYTNSTLLSIKRSQTLLSKLRNLKKYLSISKDTSRHSTSPYLTFLHFISSFFPVHHFSRLFTAVVSRRQASISARIHISFRLQRIFDAKPG